MIFKKYRILNSVKFERVFSLDRCVPCRTCCNLCNSEQDIYLCKQINAGEYTIFDLCIKACNEPYSRYNYRPK